MNSIYLKWRVQTRRSRAHKWVNRGLFEVRKDARESALIWRTTEPCGDCDGYGFGNTRVVRHEVKR